VEKNVVKMDEMKECDKFLCENLTSGCSNSII